MVRVGIAGIGFMGMIHYLAYRRVRGVKVVAVCEKSRELALIQDALESRGGRTLPEWIEVDVAAMSGRVRMKPARADIQIPVQEQLIVELYSK